MKVVQINAVCGFSSTGRTCVELADVLISNGHECKILYGNGTSDYSHAISVSNKWLVKLNALRARITGNDMGGCFISSMARICMGLVWNYSISEAISARCGTPAQSTCSLC